MADNRLPASPQYALRFEQNHRVEFKKMLRVGMDIGRRTNGVDCAGFADQQSSPLDGQINRNIGKNFVGEAA